MEEYIAHDPCNHEFEFFDTYEDAEKWLLQETTDWSEGIPEEAIHGQYLIAKVSHRSAFRETDNIANYPCVKDENVPAHCNDCQEPEQCEGAEEWPYDKDFDYVGEVFMKKDEQWEVDEGLPGESDTMICNDDVRGIMIGGQEAVATLHKHGTGERQGPRFYGDDDADVVRQANEWMRCNGGKETYPDGLQLRIR